MTPAWSLAVCCDTLLRVSRPAPELAAPLDVWCLHGVGESGIPFFPLLESEVARRHRIVVPDLPGFGASPPLADAATFDRMVTHVQQLVATFSGDRHVAFIGHSIGAMIATEAARSIGTRVHALISIEGNLTCGRLSHRACSGTLGSGRLSPGVPRPHRRRSRCRRTGCHGSPREPVLRRSGDHLGAGADRRLPVDGRSRRGGFRRRWRSKALLLWRT